MGNACITSATTNTNKVLVLGASGYVGKATLHSLVKRHGNKLDIHAGVRDPAKFGTIDKVTVVKADMGNEQTLTKVLMNYDRVFFVVPGHEDRTMLALKGLAAAKAARVRFALMISVTSAGLPNTVFGGQFKPIEEATKKSGLEGFTIIRLPMFIENNYASAGSIKESNTFYDPRDPSKLHTPVAVADVGKAAADILANPKRHYGKTYSLVMPAFNLNDLAAAFSKTLNKTVTVTTVPYPTAKQAFMGMGFLEWQVDGIMDLFHLIDRDSKVTLTRDTSDIETITGEPAMTVEQWVEQNAAGFQ